ncbi:MULTISPECIES: helix-turn-helix transcriptional regulator [unclassified Rhizobium]|uniref:helix-turn-helix transcriptional regulator n=1 Tax=unclassified Rhizobium TaxID=2613769 RepID=UPI000BCC3A7A|nr:MULTISPECIES: helix-turn-helix domain-containing protein [unclassified Rhizobium]MDH7805520.1 hypothetical protein [Rhizobium sp. AN67]MDQ4407030.1 helix-turn-helix domain-containing protein [Rhizobium sp. AN63]SOD60243.1 hypothetical protein SAMN05216595_5158 [Rhizobium sp. AN6A]
MEKIEQVDVLDDLIDETEAARLIHQTPRTLTVWRGEKKGPAFVKLGRRVFYRKSDIRAFVVAQTVKPEASR